MGTIVLEGAHKPCDAKAKLLFDFVGKWEKGRQFVNSEEVFDLSNTKARKLAYRWRGSRRGRRIAAWLNRKKLTIGVTIESPSVFSFKKK